MFSYIQNQPYKIHFCYNLLFLLGYGYIKRKEYIWTHTHTHTHTYRAIYSFEIITFRIVYLDKQQWLL